MFDNRAIAGGFAPKQIGETAGGTEDLDRLAPCDRFCLPDFRRIEIVSVPGMIQDQARGFAGIKAQATANDLLIKAYRFRRAQDGDDVNVRRIETGGEHRHVDQITQALRAEGINEASALGGGRLGAGAAIRR